MLPSPVRPDLPAAGDAYCRDASPDALVMREVKFAYAIMVPESDTTATEAENTETATELENTGTCSSQAQSTTSSSAEAESLEDCSTATSSRAETETTIAEVEDDRAPSPISSWTSERSTARSFCNSSAQVVKPEKKQSERGPDITIKESRRCMNGVVGLLCAKHGMSPILGSVLFCESSRHKLACATLSCLPTPYVQTNHFPGLRILVRKGPFSNRIAAMRKLWPKLFKFFPLSWDMGKRDQLPVLEEAFRDGQTYIIKPSKGKQGDGIVLVQTFSAVLKYLEQSKCRAALVQEYIERPLLYRGFKFDFRVYVLISSLDPPVVHVFREGLARYCSLPYAAPTSENIEKAYMHLTNYSLNKSSPTFLEAEPYIKTQEKVRRMLTGKVTAGSVNPSGAAEASQSAQDSTQPVHEAAEVQEEAAAGSSGSGASGIYQYNESHKRRLTTTLRQLCRDRNLPMSAELLHGPRPTIEPVTQEQDEKFLAASGEEGFDTYFWRQVDAIVSHTMLAMLRTLLHKYQQQFPAHAQSQFHRPTCPNHPFQQSHNPPAPPHPKFFFPNKEPDAIWYSPTAYQKQMLRRQAEQQLAQGHGYQQQQEVAAPQQQPDLEDQQTADDNDTSDETTTTITARVLTSVCSSPPPSLVRSCSSLPSVPVRQPSLPLSSDSFSSTWSSPGSSSETSSEVSYTETLDQLQQPPFLLAQPAAPSLAQAQPIAPPSLTLPAPSRPLHVASSAPSLVSSSSRASSFRVQSQASSCDGSGLSAPGKKKTPVARRGKKSKRPGVGRRRPKRKIGGGAVGSSDKSPSVGAYPGSNDGGVAYGASTPETPYACDCSQTNRCFHFVGFDVLLDENLKAWLLEVNNAPSFHCRRSELDNVVKQGVFETGMWLLGLLTPEQIVRGNRGALGTPVGSWPASVAHHKAKEAKQAKLKQKSTSDRKETQGEQEEQAQVAEEEEQDSLREDYVYEHDVPFERRHRTLRPDLLEPDVFKHLLEIAVPCGYNSC
eukprot:gb/GEZN01001154.1/.p1 GENE.gb/GEZN01001154.1/~~gb/GEZN01001154.1/.p1  ORF type:complete len:999 (+),score=178.96 gb/GEZN01001154.1/:45-3041(+)